MLCTRCENGIKYFILLFFVVLSILNTQVDSQKTEDHTVKDFADGSKSGPLNIEGQIDSYFKSEIVKELYKSWQKSRRGFETAIGLSLKESWGAFGSSLKMYVKRMTNPQELVESYYISDNIASVILSNVFLRDLPQLLMPDVSLSFASNVIRFETKLTKLFIDADYQLMRNRSDIVYDGNYDPLKTSPFVLNQVYTTGLLTIIGEDCHIIGEAVVSLSGKTPHVSFSNFRVVNCKFTIEIYRQGVPSPPVITPYFSKEQNPIVILWSKLIPVDNSCLMVDSDLQSLLSAPLCAEVHAKLQGVIVGLINNTAVFGAELYNFRYYQKKIFKATDVYLSRMVRQLNSLIIEQNQGVIDLPDFQIKWDDMSSDLAEQTNGSSVKIVSATVNGLDLAYASLRGGPIKLKDDNMILDEIRFFRIQVRGKFYYEDETSKAVYDFAAELLEVTVSVEIAVSRNNEKLRQLKGFAFKRWRELILNTAIMSRGSVYNIIAGYLQSEVPKAIVKLLSSVLPKAIDVQYDNDVDERMD